MTNLCYLTALGLNLFWLWQGDGLTTFAQLLLMTLSVAAAGAGVLARLPALSGEERGRYVRRALWVLLLYYLAIASVVLFFGGLFHLDREWGGAVNLEPFYTIRRFLIHYRRTGSLSSLSNLLGNVVILAPLGVLLPLLFPALRRCWVCLPLMALAALGVEWLQWVTHLGVADIDDSILNFIGAAAGYVLTRLCQILYQWMKRGDPNE